MFDDLIPPMRCERNEALEILGKLKKRWKIIGTDEAGRGALAGPVSAAAVYLTDEQEEALNAMGLRDSKRISPNGREKLFSAMKELGVMWRVRMVDSKMIDSENVLNASLQAMGEAVTRLERNLTGKIGCVVDGNERIPDIDMEQWVLIRGDDLIPCVSAASVVAKVLRDRLMTIYSKKYPGYDLERNKGYPTQRHINAVRGLGLSEIHRRTFCRRIMNTDRRYKFNAADKRKYRSGI